MRRLFFASLAIILSASALPARAAETITYSYDAKGRLVRVVRSGSVNNGVTTQYVHDRADNRKRLTVSGSAGSPN